MEEFLKDKYGIDINTRLNNEQKSLRVKDLVCMLRESGTERTIISNLHNSTLNKDQALRYLDMITNQLIMEGENIRDSKLN